MILDHLKRLGVDLQAVITRASTIFGIPEDQIRSPSKEPRRVKARSGAAYWAVRELGMAGVQVAAELGFTQSAVSRAVRRGEEIVRALGISVCEETNA